MGLSTVSYDSVPLGMNVAEPPHEIQDRQARYIQDGILTDPGILKRRGPVTAISTSGLSASRNKAVGIVQTQAPDGSTRVMVLTDAASGTNACFVFNDSGTQLGQISWPFALTSSTAFPVVSSCPSIGGGVWISTLTNYDANNTTSLALWRGAFAPVNTTGTFTTTLGSTAVVGVGTAWTTDMIGGFLFSNAGTYLGTIVAVGSATTLTLENPAMTVVAANAGSVRPIRGYIRRSMTGVITTSTASTTVTGVGTKLLSQGFTTNSALYRARDFTLIGQLNAAPTSDVAGTFASNATVNMDNEPFYGTITFTGEASSIQLTNTSGLFTTTTESGVSVGTRSLQNTPGCLVASHVYRQWYANLSVIPSATGDMTSRVWFSEFKNPETVDFSEKDGNFINIPSTAGASTAIRAIISTRGGLLVLKESETWVVTGTDKSTFAARKLADDGVFSTSGAIAWNGGAFWAGKHGIYWYDGANLQNIVRESLGEYYTNCVSSFTSTTKRMYATVFRDHLLIHTEYATPSVALVKGSTSSVPSKLTIVINLGTRAVSMFYNTEFRGAVTIPKQNTPWYVVNEQTTGKFHICNGSSLFDTEGNDSIICEGNGTTAGPDFYLETKRYSLGDPLRKKLFKMFLMHYFATGDGLKVDLVVGLNEYGQTNTSTWSVSGSTWSFVASSYNSWTALSSAFASWNDLAASVWLKKKVRFLKRDQFLGFRIYQNSSSVTKLRLGPWQIGFKPLRAGRL